MKAGTPASTAATPASFSHREFIAMRVSLLPLDIMY